MRLSVGNNWFIKQNLKNRLISKSDLFFFKGEGEDMDDGDEDMESGHACIWRLYICYTEKRKTKLYRKEDAVMAVEKKSVSLFQKYSLYNWG